MQVESGKTAFVIGDNRVIQASQIQPVAQRGDLGPKSVNGAIVSTRTSIKDRETRMDTTFRAVGSEREASGAATNKRDVAADIGVVGQGLFAVGVIGVGLLGDPRALSHVLFGNPLTVTTTEAAVQVMMAAAIVTAGWLLGPLLGMATFDPLHARTVGVRVGLLDTGLIVVLAMVVVIGLSSVGVLMVITLITAPAVAARLLIGRLAAAVPVACALGAFAAVAGLVLSYHLALPTGPTIAIVAAAEVAAAALVSRARTTQSRRHVPDALGLRAGTKG